MLTISMRMMRHVHCIDAVKNGVSRVHILDGRLEHCLLLEFFTNKGIGTAIINDESILYDNETGTTIN